MLVLVVEEMMGGVLMVMELVEDEEEWIKRMNVRE